MRLQNAQFFGCLFRNPKTVYSRILHIPVFQTRLAYLKQVYGSAEVSCT